MFSLTILGSNSAIPAHGRNPTAQMLQTADYSFLIDCGEGTQMQINKYKIRIHKLSHIFISHLHGDHYFGLIGLISSMSLLNRTQELHIYAPQPLQEIITLQLSSSKTTLSFPIYYHTLSENSTILSMSKMTVESFRVDHEIDCWGFIFREKKKPRSILPDKVKFFEIPSSFYENLQNGEDYTTKKGAIIKNEEVTIANSKAKSYAYCADTKYHASIAEIVKEVDLLYHETTYLQQEVFKASARFHSTTLQAGEIATLANVKQLLIGHYSSRYESIEPFLIETKSVFERTALAIEGTCYQI